MAVPILSKIGIFQFVSLYRPEDEAAPPLIEAQTTATVQRPGTNGTGVMLLGAKAQAFEMISKYDTQTFAQAVVQLPLYQALIGTAQEVTWGGLSFKTEFSNLYIILDVQPVRMLHLEAAVGGLNPPSNGWIECLWTLQPIAAALVE